MGVETISIASLALAAIGTATAVVGGIEQANATKQQANYQAQVAANNAKTAQSNAQQVTQAGEAEGEAIGLRNRAAAGELVAAEAAGGVDINSGSDVDVRASQDITGLEDRAQSQHNAFLKAYGYDVAAVSDKAQAGLYSTESSNATALEPVSALSTLAGGASQGGLNATKLYQSGAFSNPSTSDSLTVSDNFGT